MGVHGRGGRVGVGLGGPVPGGAVGDVSHGAVPQLLPRARLGGARHPQIAARGENEHHKAEAIFKAFARALRMAVARQGFGYDIPSSKGVL